MALKRDKLQTPKARKASAGAEPRNWTPAQKQQISKLAYNYFLSRGGQHGYHLEDWLKAEHDFVATLRPPGSIGRKHAELAPAGT